MPLALPQCAVALVDSTSSPLVADLPPILSSPTALLGAGSAPAPAGPGPGPWCAPASVGPVHPDNRYQDGSPAPRAGRSCLTVLQMRPRTVRPRARGVPPGRGKLRPENAVSGKADSPLVALVADCRACRRSPAGILARASSLKHRCPTMCLPRPLDRRLEPLRERLRFLQSAGFSRLLPMSPMQTQIFRLHHHISLPSRAGTRHGCLRLRVRLLIDRLAPGDRGRLLRHRGSAGVSFKSTACFQGMPPRSAH
jgi:hypothetical protein